MTLKKIQAQGAFIFYVCYPHGMEDGQFTDLELELSLAMDGCFLPSHCLQAALHWLDIEPIFVHQNVWSQNRNVAACVNGDITPSAINGTCNNETITSIVNRASFKNNLWGFVRPSQALPRELDYCSLPDWEPPGGTAWPG